MYKTFGILGLFLLLVIILIINPLVIHTAYNNILGRIILIGIVIFCSMNNVTLGLLAALCLIIASNMFFTQGSYNLFEGLENINTNTSGLTIGDDTQTSTTSDQKVNIITNALSNTKKSDSSKISELKAQAESQGVDRQAIQESIQPKSSKSLNVDKTTFSSEDVSPNDSTKEGFGSQY
jgi:hypothetical protein